MGGRVNVYVPPALYERAMEADLTFSTATQIALEAQLAVEPEPGEAPIRRIYRGLRVLLEEA